MRSIPAVLFAAALAGAFVSAQSPARIAITRTAVVDVSNGQIDRDMTIVIEGSRILSVTKSEEARVPSGARIIDGRSWYVIPGLWDAHFHLTLTRESALPALVANGVTAIRDLGGHLSEIDGWRARVIAGDVTGPHIFRAGPTLNGQEFNAFQLAITDAPAAIGVVRTLHKVGVDFIKVHRRTPRDVYFAIAEQTRVLKLPLVGHIPMTVTPEEASNAGQASIEHAETLFEGTFGTPEANKDFPAAISKWRQTAAKGLFAVFVRNNTAFTPTLAVWQHLLTLLESDTRGPLDRYVHPSARRFVDDQMKAMRPKAKEFVAEQKRRIAEMEPVVHMASESGVTIVAGTDTFAAPGFSLHDELVRLVAVGLTPAQALAAGTRNPAALFPRFNAGAVEAGKRADLVMLDANPLEDINNIRRIRAVIANGRLHDRTALDGLLNESARLARE